MMIRAALFLSCFLAMALSACRIAPAGPQAPFPAQRTQGIYVPPDYLRPTPTEPIPPIDACNARLYMGLVGRHEGSIYMASLPAPKRVLKPAFLESFDEDPNTVPPPPLIEVRDYISDQRLYAPSIRTVSDRAQLGPIRTDRITLELDRDGYVQEVRCE